MKHYALSCAVLVLWMCARSADGQRCRLSRLEILPCPLRPALPTARINQYAIYRSRIRTGSSGFLECRLRGRNAIVRNITTLGTDEIRLLYSPGSQLNPSHNYANQMLEIFNVRCNDDERVFFNITRQDIQPRDCGDPPVCADYIQVLRNGGSVVTESCGNNTGDHSGLLEEQAITVQFRTSEVSEFPGFEMYVICYRPEERDLPGCTRVEGDDATTSENDTVSGQGARSRNRRDLQLQEFGLAEKRIVMELMQSQFDQLTPADDVVVDDPKLPTELQRDRFRDDRKERWNRKKRRTDDGRKFGATAVRTAIMNENACNPILRASTRSVLTVNSRIDASKVNLIRRELLMDMTQPPTMPETKPTLERDPPTQMVTTQPPTVPETIPTLERDPPTMETDPPPQTRPPSTRDPDIWWYLTQDSDWVSTEKAGKLS